MNLKEIKFTTNNTFENITKEWLLYKRNTIKESTYCRYNYIINQYINPKLGKYKVKQLKKLNFNSIISTYDYLSNSSITLIIIVLKSILKYIERKYNIDLKIDLITMPKSTNKAVSVFTDNEKNKISNYCIDNILPKNLGILLSLYAGLRIGEISALKWKDINLNKNKIDINKTLQRVSNKQNHTNIIIDSPKSTSSIRSVLINQKLHNALYDIYISYKPTKESYVLTCKEDKYIEPRSLENYYKKILKKLKLPNYNFHVLRHTFATNCIKANMNDKLLSQILGHSNVTTTLNKYVHPSLKDAKKYLEKI